MIGIVGTSGSGKSTLAKLVQRLYLPERGRVLVDGVDLAQADRRAAAPPDRRGAAGELAVQPLACATTSRSPDPAVPAERVIRAAKLAGAHEFILRAARGLRHHGRRTAAPACPGGQRQRIAIARALITDPRILIFDEATSALDYESERIVHDNMEQICRGRTVMIIAHRLSTLRMADRVITIEAGRITEDGSHQDLIRAGGRYAKLHRLQAGA
ncbi:MAG: ATP-binding cassette domain-containing protein [Rhodopseudomonas palustris]|nr:ATP-binding cassette domain-containing protein [Rhodopseudomonas palustris]